MKRLTISVYISFLIPLVCLAQQSKIDSLKSCIINPKNNLQKLDALMELGKIYFYQGDSSKAIQYSLQAATFSRKINDTIGESDAFNMIGIIYEMTGNFNKAINYNRRSLHLLKNTSNKISIANTYNNLGIIYKKTSDYKKAIDYFIKSAKIYDEINDTFGVATTYSNIGLVYQNNKNYTLGMDYQQKALAIFQSVSDELKKNITYSMGLSASYNNIGIILMTSEIKDSILLSLDYFNKALAINLQTGNKEWVGNNYGNIANAFLLLKDYNKALEYYFKTLQIHEEISYKEGIAITLLSIGKTYFDQEKHDDAKKNIEQCLTISIKHNLKGTAKESQKLLSEIYANKRDFKAAYSHFQMYAQMKDSIFNEESSKQITEMQTRYETEKKEKEIQLLQKDKEIQTQELARQKLVRNAIAGGLLIVFIFALLLVNRFLLIRKQKKTIELEREKSEKLLLNILPKDTAEELKTTGKAQPKSYEMVTVMFTDFKGFTMLAEIMSAEELVAELDFVFKKFDEIISRYPIEKIKTIGDAYMCAGGLPVANRTNPMDVALAALDIKKFMLEYKQQKIAVGKPYFEIRIGVHTGTIVAGVVGDKKFAYDIWGDTVNTASRMESSGEAGKVNISGDTYRLICQSELVSESMRFEFRGKIKAKNKGEIEMFFVEKA